MFHTGVEEHDVAVHAPTYTAARKLLFESMPFVVRPGQTAEQAARRFLNTAAFAGSLIRPAHGRQGYWAIVAGPSYDDALDRYTRDDDDEA